MKEIKVLVAATMLMLVLASCEECYDCNCSTETKTSYNDSITPLDTAITLFEQNDVCISRFGEDETISALEREVVTNKEEAGFSQELVTSCKCAKQ